MKSINQIRIFKTLIVIAFILTIFSIATIYAYLTDSGGVNNDLIIGEVVVDIEAFYQRGEELLPIDIEQVGGGVIELNISDPDELEHFNNFHVNIKIHSSVLTYFRVNIVEQFTLTYLSGNQTTVVAVVKEGFSKFAYNGSDFYDNRLLDGFFYYKHKIKRIDEDTPTTIAFITTLPASDYHPIYENKYTIRIGFFVDAVQYYEGPQRNWGLDTPPWPGNNGW